MSGGLMATCAPMMEAVKPRWATVVFTGIPERDLSAGLSENSSRAVESLKGEIESVIAPLVLAASPDSFWTLLRERFPSYCQLLFAVSSVIASRTGNDNTMDEFSVAAFKYLADRFESARGLLGASVTENVVFSLHTTQRIYKLLRVFPIERFRNANEGDARCFEQGVASTFLTVLLLDILRLSLERDWRIAPAVLDVIASSMRHYSLEAYAAARQIHANLDPELPLSIGLDWDKEDQELAEESYNDLRLAGA
jgi:hypothetical protein